MSTDKNLHFITSRILETNVALMHCFTQGVLSIPNAIITTFKVDANGCIWYFISRPSQCVSELDQEFPVNLNYFKKGNNYSLKIHGKARLIVDPEEINSLELASEEKHRATDRQLLVCVKILKADYHEHANVSSSGLLQKMKSAVYSLFDLSQPERVYELNTPSMPHYGF